MSHQSKIKNKLKIDAVEEITYTSYLSILNGINHNDWLMKSKCDFKINESVCI